MKESSIEPDIPAGEESQMISDRLFGSTLSTSQRLRGHLAVAAGRVSRRMLRLLGRGATALPGNLALRIDPGLLRHLTADRQVFLVTGTNGKTTSVRVLCDILRAAGRTVITNPSGANLGSGLTTMLIAHTRELRKSRSGGPPLSLVFEIDEAYFAKLAADLNPQVCLVTNFFRDQLDRFGELQHTRDLIARGLAGTKATAVLCADDSLCASLGREQPERSLYFGMDTAGMQPPAEAQSQESVFCPFCQTRYDYQAIAYGHLGAFSCSGCGFARPRPDLCFQVSRSDQLSQDLILTYQDQPAEARLSVPGVHNAYNATGAVLAALAAGLPLETCLTALGQVEAAFGRMERFQAGDREVCLILVKNPVGMDRALEFVGQADDYGGMMFLLNANDPDGRDVSWIWDAAFEEYLPDGPLAVSGQRADDLALRLYYAGRPADSITVNPDVVTLFDQVLSGCPAGRCLYILPNYTAMLDLRAHFVRRYHLREFWR